MSKWIPAGLGAEPKKLIALGVLLAGLPVAYVYGPGSDDTPASTQTRTAKSSVTPVSLPANLPVPRTAARSKARQKGKASRDEFKLSVFVPDDVDITKVDPTLRVDLLARVRSVGDVGGGRSVFDFYVPPPPPVKPIPPGPKVDPPPPPKPQPPSTPPPKPRTPITLKYFGYEGRPQVGPTRALFMDGEDAWVKGTNELIRNRYRVVRIGLTSAELEDTVEKFTETLRITDPVDR